MLDCTDIEEALYRLDLKFKENCTRLSTKDIQLIIDIMIALDRCSEGSGGEGNIKNAVLYTKQFKTEAEQLIARNNIGAVDIEEVRQYIIDNSSELADILGFELLSNKQDSLTPDGTGTKYPTVDAVNEKIEELESDIDDIEGDKNFIYNQNTPSSTWEITHNLNKKPSVTVTDSANTLVEGQIIINDGVLVKITFNAPFSGTAILN